MAEVTDEDEPDISADEVRTALTGILKNEPLASSDRLTAFLTYVVEEKLAGREAQIIGKTIAQDVYDRKIDANWKDEPIVRVDAGRLRRSLEAYYAEAGKGEPVEIHIPIGSYRPQFVRRIKKTGRPRGAMIGAPYLLVGVCIVIGLAVWLIFRLPQGSKPETKPDVHVTEAAPLSDRKSKMEARRRGMLDKSPKTLQAFELAHQARKLIFPPTDRARLKSALSLFQHAIQLDDTYYGGYAGAAQVFGFMAFLATPEMEPGLLAQTRAMAKKAQKLNPGSAWVQSALAWVAFVGRDYDRALELVERSIVLDKTDPDNRIYNSTIFMFSGQFQKAADMVRPFVLEPTSDFENVYHNIYAVSSFHLGDFEATVRHLNASADIGGPTGVLTLSYFISAHSALGQHKRAKTAAEKLYATWPKFDPDKFFGRIFRHRQHADAIIKQLDAAANKIPSAAN